MSFEHAVVWLDHLRAVVIDFSVDADHVHLVASCSPRPAGTSNGSTACAVCNRVTGRG